MGEVITQAPHEIYSQLLAERRAEILRREERHRMLGYIRLAVVLAAAVLVWRSISYGLAISWLLLPVTAFAALVVMHEKLLGGLELRRRAARYFERSLARLDDQWAGTGETGERYLDPAHPYAGDLDLFGKASLFELLCTARTHIGEDTLARWLLAPAEPEIVRARQSAVEELRTRLDLREDLAVLGEGARTGVDPVALAAWGEAPPLLDRGRLHIWVWPFSVLGAAGGVSLLMLLANFADALPLTEFAATVARDLFLLAVVANGSFLYRWRHELAAVTGAVEEAADELGLLSDVLVRLERERFSSPLLAQLRASLDAEGEPPSKRLAGLNRIVQYLDSRDNVFVRVAEIFILWTPHLAVAVERWRRHSGTAVRRWLTAAGEIEALCCFASHAFEHPADPFPELVEERGSIEAEGVGHPLLPEARVVRNDVRVGGELRVLIVSGSNMSGKSTLLRTLGINTVLAQAGAPVRARRMRLSRLAVGASIRVTDSLQGGVSRFYAEILRLRQILDLTAGPLPVLFLIDEFLHGTNSHDRRIGAAALVRGLVERGAIGFITTHDLALSEIANEMCERAANVHFEDQIANGEIHFDYVMRPGVVRKSNAIELMRSVGLEI
jgi:hypothetical protein